MKVTQTTSLHLDSVAATPDRTDHGGAPQNRPAERKAVIGGGSITTPAVAAHVRKKMVNTGQRSV